MTFDQRLAWTADDAAKTADPQVAPLANRHVILRPPLPGDYDMLQMVESQSDNLLHWRRALATRPDQWVDTFWDGVLVQHLVFPQRGNAPLGLVIAYRASMHDRVVYLAALRFDRSRPSPLFMQGMGLFLDFVFTMWDFHKIYMEVPAMNMPQFSSGAGRLFEVEGRFRDHMVYAGRRWDIFLLALYRDAWQQHRARAIAAGVSTAPDAPQPVVHPQQEPAPQPVAAQAGGRPAPRKLIYRPRPAGAQT